MKRAAEVRTIPKIFFVLGGTGFINTTRETRDSIAPSTQATRY
jgi:hypothetical protein